MKHSKLSATFFIISFVLLGFDRAAHASFSEAMPGQDRRNCGDYSILSDTRDRAIFDRHCGTNREEDFEVLRDLVDRLDPKREAHAAASRGDFRLAAVTVGGPPEIGMTRLWAPAGLVCKNLKDADMVIFLRYSDVILGPVFGTVQNNMFAFARDYNKALLSKTGFPADRECAVSQDK
jgi:hypothetical protein